MTLCVLVAVLGFSFRYADREIRGSESMRVDDCLTVTVERQEFSEFTAEEWVLWFENPSGEKSAVVSEINDCDMLIELPREPKRFQGDICVSGERAVLTMNGCIDGRDYNDNDFNSSREFAVVPHYFKWKSRSSFTAESTGGRPSDGRYCPFFEITQAGAGALVALGWTGGWRADFTNEVDGVRVRAGLKKPRFYLNPGERLRTVRVLVMRYSKGEDCGNKFRRLARRYFSHVATAPMSREGVHAAFFWGGLTSDEIVRRIRRMKERGLAFDDYWVDAGWYGACKNCTDAYTGDWASFTGDWVVNSRIHPDGMKSVSAAAHEASGGLMLWFEPERIVSTSNFCREHADWLLKGAFGSHLLNYGLAPARDYVVELVGKYAHELEMTCYRQDFNFDPEDKFRSGDEKDREGIAEIRHVMGMYDVLDRIRLQNPRLLVDNCASGGRRLDLEMLRRSVFCTRSDYQGGFNANPDVIQAQNVGISRLFPYSGCTIKHGDLYALRSAYSTSHAVGYWQTVFHKEEDIDWAVVKKSHDEYRRIRRYFPCDFYNHGSATADPSAWAIWQYHDSESESGIVMAFRRSASPCDRSVVELKGLSPGTRINACNLDSGACMTCNDRLVIDLPERRSSVIYTYSSLTRAALP